MSSLCQFSLSIFVVFCISVSTTSCSQVIWKNPGESITIKCECKNKPENAMLVKVKKGLEKNVDFFYKTKFSAPIFAISSRTEYYGNFPNIQILLKNLTTNDTGAYWCIYKNVDEYFDGEGSVLLVVRDPIPDKSTDSTQPCDQASSNKNLVVTCVIISSAVLVAICIVLLLLLIRKVKYWRAENKPRPLPHNDVYEDMRGTIRR